MKESISLHEFQQDLREVSAIELDRTAKEILTSFSTYFEDQHHAEKISELIMQKVKEGQVSHTFKFDLLFTRPHEDDVPYIEGFPNLGFSPEYKSFKCDKGTFENCPLLSESSIFIEGRAYPLYEYFCLRHIIKTFWGSYGCRVVCHQAWRPEYRSIEISWDKDYSTDKKKYHRMFFWMGLLIIAFICGGFAMGWSLGASMNAVIWKRIVAGIFLGAVGNVFGMGIAKGVLEEQPFWQNRAIINKAFPNINVK